MCINGGSVPAGLGSAILNRVQASGDGIKVWPGPTAKYTQFKR